MKAEPLNIGDRTFLVNRLIQQAPTSMLIREFFKNAEENAALAPAGRQKIEIYPCDIEGVRKLAIWNTGLGMDANELKRATDLSSSINKAMALDGNFGIGAKVAGLTVSPEGIRYRSCKDGVVHQVLIGYDDDLGTYVRFPFEVTNGRADTVIDVTGAAQQDGRETDYDWTEVVLFGQSPDHDTVAEPLGKGVTVERSYIPSTIFRRFNRFAEGVEVRIDVAMTKGGGKDETGRTRQLKPLSALLDQLGRHEAVYDPKDGVTVRYIHDPKHQTSSHSLSARANPATASTTFCALVHKGERYDFKTRKAWSGAAPNFGIPFGSRVLTVEVEVPDDMALPNQYRDALTWPNDRSPMQAEQFAQHVRELMPDWVREIVRAESPEADENFDDLRADLQSLLDEFRVPTNVLSITRNKQDVRSEPQPEGEDSATATDIAAEMEIDREPWPSVEKEKTGLRAKRDKLRQAPEGSKLSRTAMALERVPEITVLRDPEQINEKNIKGRAGRYYKETQALFINGLYPTIERMAAELEAELRTHGEPEVVREAVTNASLRSMAYRVGKVTCYAISKRLSDDWNGDDLDRATSPESLSMAADDYRQSLKAARDWAKLTIKAASAAELVSA